MSENACIIYMYVFILPVLPAQQSTTQRCSIYKEIKHTEKQKTPHICKAVISR